MQCNVLSCMVIGVFDQYHHANNAIQLTNNTKPMSFTLVGTVLYLSVHTTTVFLTKWLLVGGG